MDKAESESDPTLRSARERAQRLLDELAGQRQQLATAHLAPEALSAGREALDQAIAAARRLRDAIEAEMHHRQ